MFPASDSARSGTPDNICMDCLAVYYGTGKRPKSWMVCEGCQGHCHARFRTEDGLLCPACWKARKGPATTD